jgi:hypothetical protein
MKLRRSTAGIVFLVLLASMVGYIVQTTEGFTASLPDGRGPQRCGVGLPPCLPQRGWEGVRCMNGWCRSDIAEGK